MFDSHDNPGSGRLFILEIRNQSSKGVIGQGHNK